MNSILSISLGKKHEAQNSVKFDPRFVIEVSFAKCMLVNFWQVVSVICLDKLAWLQPL